MKLGELNRMSESAAREELQRCCGSSAWAERMVRARPFVDPAALFTRAEEVWNELSRADRLEAFSHHPRIGDVGALRAKFAATASWAADEQSGTRGASDDVLRELAALNDDYFQRFGFVFLICATGKSAKEMLEALRARICNDATRELEIASREHAKITRIRLEKLLT